MAEHNIANREEMALKWHVGETNKVKPPEFDPIRIEMCFGISGKGLSHIQWIEADLLMHQEIHTFLGGYERGEEEESVYGQYQGSARMLASPPARQSMPSQVRQVSSAQGL